MRCPIDALMTGKRPIGPRARSGLMVERGPDSRRITPRASISGYQLRPARAGGLWVAMPTPGRRSPHPSDAGTALNEDGQQVESCPAPTPAPGQPVAVAVGGSCRADAIPEHAGLGPPYPWDRVRPGNALDERLSLPVVVDNDANFAARAEALVGACAGLLAGPHGDDGHRDGGASGLTATSTGARVSAGEIGHMRIVLDGALRLRARGVVGRRCARAAAGRACRRGRRRRTIREWWRRSLADGRVSGRHLTAAAQQGDPAALRAVEGVAGWLAVGIANLIAVLDPVRWSWSVGGSSAGW